MSEATPTVVPEQVDLQVWHALHQEALEQMSRLDQALDQNQWAHVQESVSWVYQRLRPHNEAEERELLPILESIGAEALQAQLQLEHREMWDLTLQVLTAVEGTTTPDVPVVLDLGQRLAALVRNHIALEEGTLLPLVRGRSVYFPETVADEGYLILEKRLLAPETWSFLVLAPMVAHGRQPGQFLMVAPFEKSERIPLTLAGGNARRGWIRFVMQEVGATTRAMGRLQVGDRLYAVAGPMGRPTELVAEGTVVLMAGGYGAAAILPAAEALRARGQRVLTILGGRSRERVLLAEELEAVSDALIVTTDDGSWGRKGLVTEALAEILASEPVAQVVAVGPVPMMRAVSELTRPQGVFTLVSLNALMVDGTGMCGGCRVKVGGESRFACFDGPDFDGHAVDFDNLVQRQSWYREQEQHAAHACHIGRAEAAQDFHLPEAVAPVDIHWQTDDLTALKASQRMTIPRQSMACQPPEVRITNFQEVSLGLSEGQARMEAARCLQCRKPACVDGCPVGIDIPGFVKAIAAGDRLGAAAILKHHSSLPAVCGRVCPQEKQCEAKCVVGIKGDAVAIGRLERYAADALLVNDPPKAEQAPSTGKRAAVVGAGPAGLTVAGELARLGHAVTVYDAFPKPGGVLLYGIPEFRLPNAIVDQEVRALARMGVRFVMNTLVGRSITLEELRKDHDAVFLGTGAGLPKMLGIPGEDAKGVYTANEFLTRINLMRADRFPEFGTPVTLGRHVVVVGCGNTAMDAARAAKRLNPESVTVVYRRSIAESTARQEELEHTMEEGVAFRWLTNPVSLEADAQGWGRTLICSVMELTEPGPDGRRGVRATENRVELPCDTLIVALGFSVNPLLAQTEPGLATLRGGVLAVDVDSGATSLPQVFAGGDVITGGATVILAMGQGKRAAQAMHQSMMGQNHV